MFSLLMLSVILLSACTAPKKVFTTSQYHEPVVSTKATKILNGLQLKALQLMKQQQFEDAIAYLQRAIKVEPRDPHNWHYLAQNYWHLKDFKNCRAMIQRSRSYSPFDEDLNQVNETWLQKCTP